MFKISVAFIALIAGVAATDLCAESMHRVCINDNRPERIPQTAEELQEYCNFAIGYFECGVKHAKECDKSMTLYEASTYLKIFQDICDQDSLLYEAVLGNLQCFSELIRGPDGAECRRKHNLLSNVALQKYSERLVEEGLLDENDTFDTMACIHMLQRLACYAVKLEDKCGKIALNAYVEITQKFAPVAECGETYYYLPTMIRLYKLVEEEANETEDVFKKRK